MSPEEKCNSQVSRLEDLAAQVAGVLERARADSTRRAYRSSWTAFSAWCVEVGLSPLPAKPETIMLYAADASKRLHRKWATIARCLAAINQVHREMGWDAPTQHWVLRQFLSGLRRQLGIAPAHKMAIEIQDLRRALLALPNSLQGKRDQALLLMGFSGAFRRSELVSLDVEDVRDSPDGLVVQVHRSKTDQEGATRLVGLARGAQDLTCPQRALRQWLEAAGIRDGPIFRPVTRHGRVLPARMSPEGVAVAVKRCVARLGLDPRHYAGHSLRAGLATAAARAGKSEYAIMRQTGHRSPASVRRYIREGGIFFHNVSGELGL